MSAEPIDVAQYWMGRVSVVLGGVLLLWGVMKIIIRPLYDDINLASWKRKRAEAEKFMREEMFKSDLEERRANRATLDRALTLAATNSDSIANLAKDIARVGSEQRAMTTLLSGIPLLAAGMETINDSLDRMHRSVDRSNDIQVEHGEKIASLSALMGEEVTGRRHQTRRATDPRILDADPSSPEGDNA